MIRFASLYGMEYGGMATSAKEAEKLMKDAYQEKIAQAICEGVQKFLQTA